MLLFGEDLQHSVTSFIRKVKCDEITQVLLP
jgi:hypothetical protein